MWQLSAPMSVMRGWGGGWLGEKGVPLGCLGWESEDCLVLRVRDLKSGEEERLKLEWLFTGGGTTFRVK